MPARAPVAEDRRPFRLAGFRRLPQHEVERVALGFLHRDTLARAQLVEVAARKLSVVRKAAHRVEDVAVGAAIGMALLLERGDHLHHRRHVSRRARLRVGLEQVQARRILAEGDRHALGECLDGLLVLGRPLHDLVVDVGDVADVLHLVARGPQPAHHHVERSERAGVADVKIVVHRRPADIEADLSRDARDEGLPGTAERVVDLEDGHGQIVPAGEAG